MLCDSLGALLDQILDRVRGVVLAHLDHLTLRGRPGGVPVGLELRSQDSLEELLPQRPDGYGLRLGERGEGLSGGQRQALAVARALLGRPSIVVFDEATSAMDMAAEAQLLQRLQQELQGRTFITITHKSSMLQLVNKIIVIEQGRVSMQGSPEELARQQRAAAVPMPQCSTGSLPPSGHVEQSKLYIATPMRKFNS